MKRIYRLFTVGAIGGLMTLFVANSAEAQHRGGGGFGGHGGGGGFHGGGGFSGGGGFHGGGSFNGGGRGNFGGGFHGGGSFNGGNHGMMSAPRSNYNIAPRGNYGYRGGVGVSPRGNYSIGPRGSYGFRGGVGVAPRGGFAYRGGVRGGYYRPGFGYSYRPGYRGTIGGRFYTPWRGGFYNRGGFYGRYYAPRIGFHLSVLPYGYIPFYYGPYQYFYSDGYFYNYDNNQYTVVEPPLGAELNSLPSGTQSIVIDGQQYYELNGVYYMPVTTEDGNTAYQVVGKDGQLSTAAGSTNYQDDPAYYPQEDDQAYAAPQAQPQAPGLQAGDVVHALPPDTRKVKINDEKYYVDPAGIYYHEERDQYGQKVYRVTDIRDNGYEQQ